jgi:UDP-N-acetylmuramoyl-L-alanyl-D-glutamate--2,6-diaminopimelate ligase
MEEYAASKRLLFQMPGLRCAVLNLDDPFGRELTAELPASMVRIGYGLETSGQSLSSLNHWLRATGIDSSESGMRIKLEGSWGEGELNTPLLGHFNVSNLLAVLAVLLQRGLPLQEALSRLAGLRTVPGRMERFGEAAQPLVVVDYAHTPDALEHVLTALRDHTRGRLFCLFGCGGERDRGKRPQMGAIAEALADRIYVTDDNPRREDGARIREDILAGMRQPDQALVVADRAQAIRQIINDAGQDDLVLIAGKGHETSQQVGDLKIPFSDREQVLSALAGDRE